MHLFPNGTSGSHFVNGDEMNVEVDVDVHSESDGEFPVSDDDMKEESGNGTARNLRDVSAYSEELDFHDAKDMSSVNNAMSQSLYG